MTVAAGCNSVWAKPKIPEKTDIKNSNIKRFIALIITFFAAKG
jgi:hypothetical protein